MLAILPKIIVFSGSLLLLAGVIRPLLVVQGYLVVRPMVQPFAWLQYKLFGLPVALPLSVIVIALGMLLPLARPHWVLIPDRGGFLLLFLFIAMISAGLSADFKLSVAALVKLATVWFLYVIAFNSVQDETDARGILDAVILSSVIPVAFGFYQEVTGNYDMIYDAEVDRVSSVFATGNDYGIFLSLVTGALAIRLLVTDSRAYRILLLLLLVVVLVSQVLALNRGTWVALTLGLAVASLRYRRHLNLKWLLLGVLVFLAAFSGRIMERFAELNHPSEVHYAATNTLEGRFAYWRALVPVVLERPVIGHGIGTNTLISEERLGRQHKLHNDYLLVFLETGALGLIAYVAFLWHLLVAFLSGGMPSRLWPWGFSMLMLTVYFVVMLGFQNIVQSILNFLLFLVLVATASKLALLAPAEQEMQHDSLGHPVPHNETHGE
ncbi:O-antigen ligase family protein [endosymbiont of unidentified scaly snail isolate Monju]|uniref:O-antigen ligase family protein n=1 Tax=endosymbiont of unidentified scaly snail isolate Monju TaxID=1248727 RepID=UPI0003891F66|nr:O-antigen ligase family protein [endosymbiont of unidentified scaly snail isolate Monju]BAN68882.1 hypothetical protein EBS_0949 [endosymbiont of unidentified scaly snail isolate Monju]